MFQELTSVPQSTLSTIGTGSGTVTNLPTAQHGQPVLKGDNGLPEVFYVGAEYCPYCAAERWAMINALSRFGTFSKLSQIQSYEDNISTFSFYGSNYTSQYVDFAPVEVNGNALASSGDSYVPLQQMSADQQKNFEQYNSAGSFPYVNMGNQYIGIGASYDPTILLDSSQKPYSWQIIASSLSNTKSQIAQGILGTANYLTAGICGLTNQQPANVCNVPAIQSIEQALNKTSSVPSHNGGNLGLSPSLVAVDLRQSFSLSV